MKNLYLTYNVCKMFFVNVDKRYYYSIIAGLLLAVIISNGVDVIRDERYFMSTNDIQHNKIKVNL